VRVLGYLVDYFVVAIPVALLYFFGVAIGDTFGGLIVLFGWLLGIGLWVWNRGIKQGAGQSIGKEMMGTRLVAAQTGLPVGTGMALLRDIAHILDSLPCYIGWLWPLWDVKRQTFADKVVSTFVYKT
jgi:uncharacterized RDD family membrane protein YckC